MSLTLAARQRLNDGREVPRLGLGVYRAAPGGEARAAVRWALEAGYRHLDTASAYGNERDVGDGLRDSGLAREEVYVTTKLWNSDQGYEQALRACRQSLKELGLGYVDLYLIHWPIEELRRDSWRALVQLQKDGLCRSIGVSNFTAPHLEQLRQTSDVVPAVNQVEMHPFLAQRELRGHCAREGIAIEAYSPLVKGRRFDHPVVAAVARRCGRSPAQVLLRWALEQGVVAIPKSVRHERIQENAAVFDFELAEEDLRALDGLDADLHTAWNPTAIP